MPASTPEANAQRRALELLRGAQRFLLTGHVRPDGDCVGAQAALARVLEALGKDVWIVNPDPLQAQFDYLGRAVRYRSWDGGDLPVHDVACLLDCSELSRCGDLAGPIECADSRKLVIDHHVHHGEAWWDEAYVDVTASATGLLVLRIARELGVELDTVAAQGVMTSIVTDTGWFKYSNTDAETLRAAADLAGMGVAMHELFASIYQRAGRDQPRAVARLLSRLEYFADGRLAVVDLPLPGPGEPELADGDEVLDMLRAVESVEVVLFLRELRAGGVKLSARSKTDYDVNRLARQLGGGGHVKASGASLPGPLSAARERVVALALEGFEVGTADRAGDA